MSRPDDELGVLGRARPLFEADIARRSDELDERVRAGSFLVVGGAGSIGQALVRELFSRNPHRLHVVDPSENNLVELVRDIRSSLGYGPGDFQTLPLDARSRSFDAFLASEAPYDYVLDLAALKHVRSERDSFTLMRMLEVNVLLAADLRRHAEQMGARCFVVSSDKAVRPASAMGASKALMEHVLFDSLRPVPASSTRFANVAFSDGSLLHGWRRRLEKRQPLSAPEDVRRYFITEREAGRLCLLALLAVEDGDILVPHAPEELRLGAFPDIARAFLAAAGYEAVACDSEEEARSSVEALAAEGRWPCWFFPSDTSGEKPYEEFVGPEERAEVAGFEDCAVVRRTDTAERPDVQAALEALEAVSARGRWTREELLEILEQAVPAFRHRETHRHLDGRM